MVWRGDRGREGVLRQGGGAAVGGGIPAKTGNHGVWGTRAGTVYHQGGVSWPGEGTKSGRETSRQPGRWNHGRESGSR